MRTQRKIVAEVEREDMIDEDLTCILSYTLYREFTPSNHVVHYISGYMVVRREGQLLREDLEIAGVPGGNPLLAVELFNRIAEADEPVFPVHLHDVVSDGWKPEPAQTLTINMEALAISMEAV